MGLIRARLVIRYVLGEMIPTFFLGVTVFVFILLMFQALKLTELALGHGVKVSVVAELMGYLSIGFLPVLFPMSLLFAVLLTYSRLSADSEIVALKAAGLGMGSIITPAVILSTLIAVLSAQTAFHVAPWANRQAEVLVAKMGSQRPGIAIKEGTFAEGFFDLVVYANRVDSKNGLLREVFIYDESNPERPITVIAQEGKIVADPDKPGHEAMMRLSDGDIHQTSGGRHTKVHFGTYDIKLVDPITENQKAKSPRSMTLEELQAGMRDQSLEARDHRRMHIEYNMRLAISIACILFALIGAGLGTTTNRRAARSSGLVMCLGLIVAYWVMYVACENLAKQGTVNPALAAWTPDLTFLVAAFFILRRAWR